MTVALLSLRNATPRLAQSQQSRRPDVRSKAVISCSAEADEQRRRWAVAAAGAAASALLLVSATPAFARLNKFEEAAGGEFNIGTAQQFGEADKKYADFHGQNLQRSNFTAADVRGANFKDAKLAGAYFIKGVLANANFENADLSDTLMDRAVIVEANLKNAILQRAVLTASDLRDAVIEGADFSNALVDRSQQLALCRYADGTNPVTGVSTRKSLGCGSRRAFRAMSPSDPDGPQVTEASKEAFKASLNPYYE